MPLTETHLETSRRLDDAFYESLAQDRLDEDGMSFRPWYSRCLSALVLVVGQARLDYAGVGSTTHEPDSPCLIVFTERDVHLIETSTAVRENDAAVITVPRQALITRHVAVKAKINAEGRAAQQWPGEIRATFRYDGLPEFTVTALGFDPYNLKEAPAILDLIEAF